MKFSILIIVLTLLGCQKKEFDQDEVKYLVENGLITRFNEKLDQGLDPNLKLFKGKRSLFLHAIAHNQRQIAQALLDKGVKLNGPDANGGKSLQAIAYLGINNQKAQNTWDFLILSGADVNYQDGGGDTPLHTAIKEGRVKVVEYLVRKADRSIKNDQGKTPLDLLEDCIKDSNSSKSKKCEQMRKFF